MKYLQIYDHNGNLTREFPVYVDGEDFNWAADKPECLWLGSIWLVSEPSEILVTSTPEPEPIREYDKVQAAFERGEEKPEPEPEIEPKLEVESEVKDEPTKRVHKRGRAKRASSPDGA